MTGVIIPCPCFPESVQIPASDEGAGSVGEKKLKKNKELLTANPLLVLREEFDDWAVLFDPDTGDAFGLNPVSVFVWKRLDGKHTIQDILKELREQSDDVPETAGQDIEAFIDELVEKGYAGYEVQ